MDRNRELDRIRYLEAVYDWQQAKPGQVPNLIELFGENLEGGDDYWRSILESLTNAGLMRDASGMGGLAGIAGWPTAQGQEYVEELRKRRRNPAVRRKAATTLLLHWIDLQDQGNPSWMQIYPTFNTLRFEGDPLTETELRGAAQRLADDGLIEAKDDAAEANGPGLVRIRPDGQRCVESGLGVDEWVERNKRQEPPVQYIFSGNFHESNVAGGGTNFTQTLSSSGLAADELKVLLDAVVQAMPLFGLSADQTVEVQRNVDVVRAEIANSEPDKALIKTLTGRIVTGIGKGTEAAVAASLMLLFKWEMTRIGIPLDS